MDDYNAADDNYSNIPADDHDDYWEAIVHPKSHPRITLSHMSPPAPPQSHPQPKHVSNPSQPYPSPSHPYLNCVPPILRIPSF